MNDDQKGGTQEHDRGGLPFPVDHTAEEGGHEDIPEGKKAGNQPRESGLDVVLLNHEVGCVLQEGEYRRVEEHAEHSDIPEPQVFEDQLDVGDTERVLFLLLFARQACLGNFKLLVHEAVNDEADQPDAEHDQGHENRGRNVLEGGGDGRTDHQGEGGADSGRGQLHSHGQSHLLPLEPPDDGLGNRDPRHLHTDSENCIADGGQHHLSLPSEKGCVGRKGRTDGKVFEAGPNHHDRGGGDAGEADSHLVQNDSPDDQHQEEDVKPPVGTGKEAVFTATPSTLSLQHRLQRGHDIGEKVAAEHGYGNNAQRGPSRRRRLTQGLFNPFHHFVNPHF